MEETKMIVNGKDFYLYGPTCDPGPWYVGFNQFDPVEGTERRRFGTSLIKL
jgi:hypothetical protein